MAYAYKYPQVAKCLHKYTDIGTVSVLSYHLGSAIGFLKCRRTDACWMPAGPAVGYRLPHTIRGLPPQGCCPQGAQGAARRPVPALHQVPAFLLCQL